MHHKDIVIVFENEPHVSVAGVTREKVMPHDRLEFEGAQYRVAALQREGNVTAFFAHTSPAPVSCTVNLSALVSAHEELKN